MVREILLSAGTLAGLIGLACLYRSPENISYSRTARAADFFEGEDNDDYTVFDDDITNDKNFLADFDIQGDDVMMFQSDEDSLTPEERAGGAKKQISQVKQCLRNPTCTKRAQKSVATWASNSNQYITANPERLLKAVNSGIEELDDDNSDFGMCTPNDDALPCESHDDQLFQYNRHHNADPKTLYSTNAAVQAAIENYADSTAVNTALEGMSVQDAADTENIFGRRAGKVFLVIPNGIPVSMPENYNYRFGNYWRWFKKFNEKYIGIATKNNVNRSNMHFWFLRQDKNLKIVMKNPAKTSGRFPWRRFDSLMLNNQNSAAQPKLRSTFEALSNTINNKGMASEAGEGQDCFTIWFHQYVPQDILDISDSLFQENIVRKLEQQCTIIHIWVGMQALENDENTLQVIRYLQGLLQPEQLKSTSADPQRRRYYFIDNLENLVLDQGTNLMDQIYNDMVFERNRATCLLSTSATDLGAVFESANDRFDEYYDEYVAEDMASTTAYDFQTSAFDYDLAYDASTTEIPSYEAATTEAQLGPPDFKCCGIGFGGRKYDVNSAACCDDGSVAGSEADCYLA